MQEGYHTKSSSWTLSTARYDCRLVEDGQQQVTRTRRYHITIANADPSDEERWLMVVWLHFDRPNSCRQSESRKSSSEHVSPRRVHNMRITLVDY